MSTPSKSSETINVQDATEVLHWAQKIGVTPDEIKRAVQEVGPIAHNVQSELLKARPKQNPESPSR